MSRLLSRLEQRRRLRRRKMLERQLLKGSILGASSYFAAAAVATALISLVFPPAGVFVGAVVGVIGAIFAITIILAPLGVILL